MVLYFKPRNVSAGFFLLRVNHLTWPQSGKCK